MTALSLPIAAIRFGDGDRVDDLLESVVKALQSYEIAVAGYLQRETPEAGCCSIMHLEEISSGHQVRISQALGKGSRGCRLDPRALAEVSGLLLNAMGSQTDLLVVNRFGKGESDGQGFRAAMEKACELGIPVLTAVRGAYEPAWIEFIGGAGTFLQAERDIVVRWAMDSIADRRRSRDAA